MRIKIITVKILPGTLERLVEGPVVCVKHDLVYMQIYNNLINDPKVKTEVQTEDGVFISGVNDDGTIFCIVEQYLDAEESEKSEVTTFTSPLRDVSVLAYKAVSDHNKN